MFAGLAKKNGTPNALNEVFESRVKGIDKSDYLALMSLYLQVFNPSRANSAEQYLAKYKGKEAEMFAKLASKWNTCNPLDNAASVQVPSPEKHTTLPPVVSVSAPAPSPFASGSAPAPSPFGAGAGSAPGPSPFGGGSAPGPSPFGAGSAPAPSPFGAEVKTSGVTTNDSVADENKYNRLLTEFYEKHNPQKVNEVSKTLEKYKGREEELFNKLAHKYSTANPLASPPEAASSSMPTSFGFGGMTASLGVSKSPFGGENKSPFSSSGAATTASATSTSAFGGGAGDKSPFSSTTTPGPAPAMSPFSSTSGNATFGMGTSGSSPSPFGAPASATPFSSSAATFGAGSTFGQGPAAAPAAVKFGGRNPRDILVSFYQQHNPSKLNDIDKVLTKYAGKEEQLFLNLAKKYNLDPAMFGVSAPQPAAAPPASGSGTGFGAFASAGQGGGGFHSLASAPAAGAFGGFGGGFGGSTPQPSPFGAGQFGAARR